MSAAPPLEVDVSDLPPGAMRAIAHGSTNVLLCNVDGRIHAIENLCSHAAVPLSEGRLRGCEIECELHGAVFDVRSGEAIALPARAPIRTFAVERRGDRVVISI